MAGRPLRRAKLRAQRNGKSKRSTATVLGYFHGRAIVAGSKAYVGDPEQMHALAGPVTLVDYRGGRVRYRWGKRGENLAVSDAFYVIPVAAVKRAASGLRTLAAHDAKYRGGRQPTGPGPYYIAGYTGHSIVKVDKAGIKWGAR